MVYAIIGSRSFNDYELTKKILNTLPNITKFVSGGAKGADFLAERYADEHNIEMFVYEPDWATHGRGAANIRNKEIVDAADKIIAFWDMQSPGTNNAIQYARKSKKPVLIVSYLTGCVNALI